MSWKDAIETLSFDEVKEHISQMKYGLIYETSVVKFDRMDKISDINWNEVLEGYFFNDTTQIHIYNTDDGFKAVCFSEPENADYIDKEYELAGKYHAIGKRVKKREYLDYDADGQVYVAYTRLVDVI